MRPDLYKVIVERPRVPGRVRYRRAHAPIDPETTLSRGPMKPRFWDRKCLNENLAPLRRWLRSNVGRPWDKVYSELRAQISAASTVQAHVLIHLFQYVERDVVLVDGVACRLPKRWPLSSYRPGDTLYVCPKTGILREAPVVARKNKKR